MAVNYNDYKQHIADDVSACISDMGSQPILFVGSGFAQRYMKGPSWDSLLKILAERCPVAKPYAYYRQMFSSEIQIGTQLSMAYFEWAWGAGNGEFPEEYFGGEYQSDIFIKHATAKYLNELLKSVDLNALSDALKSEIEILGKINPYTIITTNYDLLLESIFGNYEPVIGQQIIKSNVFAVGEIFKIHGSASAPDSVVITENDYKEFHERQKYLSAKLLTLFVEHPILFVGYRATDPNICALLSDIDEILSGDNSVIPNIYLLTYEEDIKEADYPAREHLIPISGGKTVKVKAIHAGDFCWVYEAFSSQQPIEHVNPKLLRALLARTYDVIRTDIPKRTVEVNMEVLTKAVSEKGELAKLYGITVLDDPAKANIIYKYQLTDLAEILGYGRKWHYANELIKQIEESKGVNIKSSDNSYHMAIAAGKKMVLHKYSDEALNLMRKVKDGDQYDVELPPIN